MPVVGAAVDINLLFSIDYSRGRAMRAIKSKRIGTLPTGFPKKCKWNAFTIDREERVWKDELRQWENIFHNSEDWTGENGNYSR